MVALLTTAAVSQAEFRTWTKTNGEHIEAELAGQTTAAVKLRTKNGSMEIWSKDRLSEEDRAFIGIGGSTAAKTETPAAEAPPEQPATTIFPITRQLGGKLVSMTNGVTAPVPASRVAGVKYYAFYYSASWCPPCRAFTPDLVEAYKKIKAKHPEFEIVFVSSDESESAMKSYMKGDKMEWTAVRFADIASTPLLEKYSQRGIPNLVFVDGSGKVLSASYEGGNYVGPRKVLADIKKTLN
ncbi:thioredoxin-like domain-containing protein [Rariglobus hedericola]|nr:thioredoxin-like domain-containing protein [Rariglobus hedericola]